MYPYRGKRKLKNAGSWQYIAQSLAQQSPSPWPLVLWFHDVRVFFTGQSPSPPPWHSLVGRRQDLLVAPPRGFFSGQVGWNTSQLLPFSSTDTYSFEITGFFFFRSKIFLSEDTQDCLGTIGHSKAMSGGSLGCLCRWAWRSYWTCIAWQGGEIWSLDDVMRGVRVVSVSGRGLAAASFVHAPLG